MLTEEEKMRQKENCILFRVPDEDKLEQEVWEPERDSQGRIMLNCPFSQKEKCKQAGARWDGQSKKWYVPDGVNAQKFKDWWPPMPPDWVSQQECLCKGLEILEFLCCSAWRCVCLMESVHKPRWTVGQQSLQTGSVRTGFMCKVLARRVLQCCGRRGYRCVVG